MEDAETRPRKMPRAGADSGLTLFALRLAKTLAEGVNDAGKNMVFSPVSIYSALALVAAGARGDTLDELLAVLGAASRDELAELVVGMADGALADRPRGLIVAFAWSLWHEKTVLIKPAYRAVAAESYKTEIHAVDFEDKAEESREEINNWVSNATKQRITSILPEGSVHRFTRLVIANVIYFKGAWNKPFPERYTDDGLFYRLDGSKVRVPFMSSQQDQFVEWYHGFKVLKLPYCQDSILQAESDDERHGSEESDERSQFSMVILLPDDRRGLPSLVERMASKPSFLWDHLPDSSDMVGEFLLPKFKISFSSEINGVLKYMGIKMAFDEHKADLKDMLEEDKTKLLPTKDPSVDLYVEKVMHKAFIEVNEAGTEAAASTTCSMRVKQSARRVNFVADHPFAFFVVEEVSGTIVFMGHVLDPSKSE